MSRIVMLLVLSVVLAILKALLIGLAIMLVIALTYSFIIRPRETLLFMGVVILSGLAGARPMACLVVGGVVAVALVIASVIGRSRRRGGKQLALADGRESS